MIKDKDLQSNLQSLFEEHDFNKTYEDPSIVLHTTSEGSDVFLSTKNVPRFVSILNDNFWQKITKDTVLGDQTDDQSGEDEDVGGPLCFTAVYDSSIVSLFSKSDSLNIQVSIDGGNTWRNFETDPNNDLFDDDYLKSGYIKYECINLNKGQSVYFKGTNSDGYRDTYTVFVGKGLFDLSGRLVSLSDNNKTIEINKNVSRKHCNFFASKYVFDSNYHIPYLEDYSDNLYIRSAKDLIISRPTADNDYGSLFYGQIYMTELPKLYEGYIIYGKMMYENFGSPEVVDGLEAMGITPPTPPTDYDDFCNNTIYSLLDLMIFQGADYSEVMQGSQGEAIAAKLGLSYIPNTIEEFANAMLSNKEPIHSYGAMFCVDYKSAKRYKASCFANRNTPVIQLSNDGTTFNFNNDFEFPIGNNTTPLAFALDRFENANGFEKNSLIIYFEVEIPEYGGDFIDDRYIPSINSVVTINNASVYEPIFILDNQSNVIGGYAIYDSDSTSITLQAPDHPGFSNTNFYYFEKWKQYSNENWTDYSTDTDITIDVTTKNVKYKACYNHKIVVRTVADSTLLSFTQVAITDINGNQTSLFKKNEPVVITCTLDRNYALVGYKLNNGDLIEDDSGTYMFTDLQTDTSFTPVIELRPRFEVRVYTNDNDAYGTAIISCNGYTDTSVIVICGEEATILATPNSGYKVVSYKVDGVDNLTNDTTFDVSNLAPDVTHNVFVIFEPIT